MINLDEFFKSVRKCGYAKDIIDDTEARKQWDEERYDSQTNLFWLAKSVLGYDLVDNFHCTDHWLCCSDIPADCKECGNPMSPYPGGIPTGQSPHREICSFFISKKPRMNIASQDTRKTRLLMEPRGGFKSSIDEADIVQWIICFPNISIGVLCATEDLSALFVEAVRRHFVVQESPNGERIYTRFQLLFPEHCVSSKKREEDGQFTSPAKSIGQGNRAGEQSKEPTILAISLKKSTSGLHFDLVKFDDAESNSNSGPSTTQEQRDRVRQDIELAGSLINPYGYKDYIGTPYHEQDAYAHIQEHASEGSLYTLIRPAWKVKDSSRHIKEAELGESDYEFLFPVDGKADPLPRLTYGFLREKQRNDPINFANQYLCKPSSARKTKFTEQLLRAHITQSEGLPQLYRTFCAWDCAYSTEKGRDYSVGTAGWFDPLGRVFVVDIIRGRFGKAELALNIAKLSARWRPERVVIENSPGMEFLETDIRREMVQLGYEPAIEWKKVDTSKDAKESRAENLETWLLQDRLWFSSELSLMSEIINEFVRFMPGTKRKDDIVDSIAHLVACAPPIEETPKNEKERQEAAMDLLKQKQIHDMIYLVGVEPPPPPEAPPMTQLDGYPIGCTACGYAPCICR